MHFQPFQRLLGEPSDVLGKSTLRFMDFPFASHWKTTIFAIETRKTVSNTPLKTNSYETFIFSYPRYDDDVHIG